MAMFPRSQPGQTLDLPPVALDLVRAGLFSLEGCVARIQSADKSAATQNACRAALDAIHEVEKALSSGNSAIFLAALKQLDHAQGLLTAEGWGTLTLMVEIERYLPRVEFGTKSPEWRFYNPLTGQHDALHDAGFSWALRPKRGRRS